MKKLLLALAITLLPSLANAACTGQFGAGSICGNSGASAAIPGEVTNASIIGTLPLPSTNILVGNASGKAAAVAPTGAGDCTFTISNAGVFTYTCTKTAGVAFAPSATTDTTNAVNISSGTLPAARLTRTGNTSTFVTASGALASSHCPTFDANGNIIDAGSGCPVSPAQYGAVCNNSTDDTTALNNMYAGIAVGSTIQYPASLCKITGVVTIGTSSTSNFPAGGGITSTGTGFALKINASFVTINCSLGATINGPRTPSTGNDYLAGNSGIFVNGANGAVFIDVLIQNCGITNFKEAAIWAQFCNQCYFYNNQIQSNSYAGILCLVCSGAIASGNYINGISSSNGPASGTNLPVNTKTNAYGITFTTDGAGHFSQYSIASDNVINNIPTWECLDTHAGIGIKFVNNHLTNCRVGIAITTDGGTNPPSQIVVSGNLINCIALGSLVYPGSSGIAVGGGGITVFGVSSSNNASDVLVTNNNIISCGSSETGTAAQASIDVGSVNFLRVEQNNITAGRWRGIHLTSQILGIISGNTFNAIVAGGIASGNILIHVDTASCQCILSRHYGNSSASEAYFITAQGGGFQVGIARDNYFPNVTALYDASGPATNRVDLGATAP